MILDAKTVDLEGWIVSSFITRQWWSKWSLHLFFASAKTYCHQFDPNFIVPDDEATYLLLIL
jgi:hypothetical protein